MYLVHLRLKAQLLLPAHSSCTFGFIRDGLSDTIPGGKRFCVDGKSNHDDDAAADD